MTERVPRTHVVIPDTQTKPGVPIAHLNWIGRYIVDQFAGRDGVTLIHLGDHWDLPALSSYDRGTKSMEGRRYVEDIAAGNNAFDALCAPLECYNKRQRARHRRQWWPDRHFLLGNHENRITRACELDAQMDGLLSLEQLNAATHGWRVHEFLKIVRLDGIAYSHYFINNATGAPISGMIETRIKSIGCSFVQGHQQGLKAGMIETVGGRRRGLVAGSAYLHNEAYRGPQATNEWRGILVLHEVEDGDYCLMEVSLAWLCSRYEGVSLTQFMRTFSA